MLTLMLKPNNTHTQYESWVHFVYMTTNHFLLDIKQMHQWVITDYRGRRVDFTEFRFLFWLQLSDILMFRINTSDLSACRNVHGWTEFLSDSLFPCNGCVWQPSVRVSSWMKRVSTTSLRLRGRRAAANGVPINYMTSKKAHKGGINYIPSENCDYYDCFH